MFLIFGFFVYRLRIYSLYSVIFLILSLPHMRRADILNKANGNLV